MGETVLRETWPIKQGDFALAGEASSAIKRMIKRIGVNAAVVRRVAVATYEVELNQVIHSQGGEIILNVDERCITIIARDDGPGIPDIDKAMTEGFSTASERARSMGFGAGMGLPNMRRNADGFDIKSELGVGTTISMTFNLS